jgi:thiamine pyrophosphate-dependent acetolactate synthase large subunit-like protein
MLYQAYDYFGVKGQVVAESNDLDALLKECLAMNNYNDIFIRCTMDNTCQWVTRM